MPGGRISRGLTGVVVARALAIRVHGVYMASFVFELDGSKGTRTGGAQLAVARGAVMWGWWGTRPWTPLTRGWTWKVSLLPTPGSPYWFNTWVPTTPGAGVFPLWAPALGACALLAVALRRWTPGPGTGCPRCGYDCSGVGSDRCPECGTLRTACASSTSQPD